MKNKLNFKSILFAIALLFSPNLTLSGTMDDLNTVNKILVAFQKNDIEKAEQLAQEIDDVALQSIWAVNVVLKYLELDDLNSALEVLNLVQDQSLKDIWLANIALRSLQKDNCEVASAATEQIIDSSLSTIYKMNVKQKCSTASSVLSSASSVVSNLFDKSSEGADDSSADVAAVDDESVLSSASSVLSSASSVLSSASSVVSNLFDKSSEGADDSSADVAAVDDELESSSNVALSGEGFEWICTSRDKDGRAPYAIAIEDKNTSKFQISKAVFSTMEECNTVLSQPIEILDGKKFFCSSRDSDGRSPFAAFRWNVENNSLINFDKLLLVYDSTQSCMDSLVNVSVRDGIAYVCASRDKDGRAPYAIAIEDKNTSKFQISKAVFSTMEECNTVLSQPIEILDGKKFFCSSRDSDGRSPFAAFRWNVENNSLINFDKLLLVYDSTQSCMDSLVNVSVRDGIAYVCASRDKDGRAPYSKFQISENPDPVGHKHSSLEDCIKTE